jgi:hypothetical protein
MKFRCEIHAHIFVHIYCYTISCTGPYMELRCEIHAHIYVHTYCYAISCTGPYMKLRCEIHHIFVHIYKMSHYSLYCIRY